MKIRLLWLLVAIGLPALVGGIALMLFVGGGAEGYQGLDGDGECDKGERLVRVGPADSEWREYACVPEADFEGVSLMVRTDAQCRQRIEAAGFGSPAGVLRSDMENR